MAYRFDTQPNEEDQHFHSTMDMLEASQERANRQRTATAKSSWHGLAFVLEAIMLVLMLACSTAVIASLLANSFTRGETADALSTSVMLASTNAENSAEAFAHNPTDTIVNGVTFTNDGTTTTVSFYHKAGKTLVVYDAETLSTVLPDGFASLDDVTAGNLDAFTTHVTAALGEDTYVVTRTVTHKATEVGTLYYATITVSQDDSNLYALDTSVYESGRG